MNLNSRELKQKARFSLTGKYSVSALCVILIASCSFGLSELIDHTGFALELTLMDSVFYWIMIIILMLLEGVFSVGLLKFFYNMAQRLPISPRDLTYGFMVHPDKFILISAFRYATIMIWLIPGIIYGYMNPEFTQISQWLISFLLYLCGSVGSIYFYILYSQTTYILLDNPECSVREALHESRELLQGYKGRLLFILLSFIGWLLLAIGSFGIGYLWIKPYFHMTMTYFYLDLTQKNEAVE